MLIAEVPATGVAPLYAASMPAMMPPPIVPPVANAFPRGPSAPPPPHTLPHSGSEPELSADDQQQAQLLMQVFLSPTF